MVDNCEAIEIAAGLVHTYRDDAILSAVSGLRCATVSGDNDAIRLWEDVQTILTDDQPLRMMIR